MDFWILYARWDAGWYFNIASVGYPTAFDPTQRNAIAFFPGLPLLMRATGTLLDVNLWAAGVIAITVAFLWALTYVYRLARLDLAQEEAKASLLFLAFYPFAICYSVVLTESLFLLAAAAAFFHFRRNEFWTAAAFGFLAGLLRPNGFLLSVPLGLIALIGATKTDRDWRRFFAQAVAASVPVVGMLAYALYVNSLVGNPFAWVRSTTSVGAPVGGDPGHHRGPAGAHRGHRRSHVREMDSSGGHRGCRLGVGAGDGLADRPAVRDRVRTDRRDGDSAAS